MKLYKYTSWRPLDGACDHDNNCSLIKKCYTKDNIINSQLYFNSARAFNDPFDLYPQFMAEGTADEIFARAIEAVSIQYGITGAEAEDRAREMLSQQDPRTLEGKRKAIESQLNLLGKLGVCCFSASAPDNTLMWGHYAEGHTGVCLEFEIPDGKLFKVVGEDSASHPVVGPLPVKYENQLPKYNLFTGTSKEMSACLTTKSLEWQYEKEYRSISFRYLGLIEYEPAKLTAVIAGCRMHNKEFEELQKTISLLKVPTKLLKVTKKEREFGFNFVEY